MKNVRKGVRVVVTCLTEAAVADTVTLRLSCVLLQLLSTTSAVATFVSEAVCKISFAFDEERISCCCLTGIEGVILPVAVILVTCHALAVGKSLLSGASMLSTRYKARRVCW